MTKTATLKGIALTLSMSLWAFTNVCAQRNESLINAQLVSGAEKYGLTKSDVSDYIITDEYTDNQTGLTYTYIQQSHNKIGVYNAISVFLIKDNKVAYFKPVFISNLNQKIKTDKPAVTPEAAIAYALVSLGRSDIAPVKLVEEVKGKNTFIYDSPGISASPVKVQLVYRAMDDGIYLAWDVSIEMKNEAHWWNVRIDALAGNYLDKNDWTVSCSFDNPLHNCAEHQYESAPVKQLSPLLPPPPLGEYNVYALPVEAPSFGGRTNLINPEDLTASPFGWHDDNGIAGNEYTITRGNNVHAYEDANNDNLPGYSPNSGTLQFNFPVDLTQAPLVNQDASITNLFYVNNRIHDVLYHAGFTEVAGNFQQNNYGNGGLGNDYVQAEAFDGSGTNNANFGTPADGSRPRMQMYLWTAPNPDRDGSFDNGIVAHEFGHGVSNRLTGGPAQAGCLGNAEQGGEGWSDWLALMLTTEASDAVAGGMLTQARGIGTYALNQATNGQGIRRFKYSVDMSINPQTYADLATSGTGPHNKGEIWCDAIWDMSCFLINDLGFNPDPTVATAGNNIAMRLVLEGMKLQPCSPGYLDARDAILTADAVLYGNAHRCRIWEAFARRGMGFNAVQGSSNSSTDQTAGFLMPPVCLVATQPPVAAFTSDLSTIPCAGTVQFTDGSTQAFTSAWDFGDGGNSILTNPTHQYNSPGTYNVKLVVTNTLGSDSVMHPITVSSTFSAAITASPNPVACGLPLQLNAVASGSSNFTYSLASIPFAPVTGTPIAGPAGDDVVSSFIPIGFNFPFYNAVQTQLKISTNGFISFNSNSGSGCCAGATLPNNSTTLSNLIAVCWTDLLVGAPNSVDYFNLTSPNRFVIRWNAVAHCCATTPAQVTTQIILYETGEIEMHNTSILTGIDVMTMGIENANGTVATVVPGRNASNFTASNEAWKFTPAVNYTYNWQPGNLNGASQTVNPVANSTYTVNVADGSGCVQPFTTPLINVIPVTVAIGGSTTFCTGGSTTLDAGSYSTYNWSTGATTQTITVNTAGTFTVSVTNAGGCSGSGSITTSLSTSLTPVILGDLSICSGNTNILDAGVGYATYNWSTGATTQTISVSTAGTFTVTVSNGAGCSGTASSTTTIDVIPSPSISGSLMFCPGNSTVLTTGLFAAYSWSTGATTQSVSVNSTGVFTVAVTNVEGCTSSASVTTTNYTLPIPVITGATAFCTGSSTILDAGVYNSYAWSTGATTQTITVSTASVFTVTVTGVNGCTTSTSVTTTLFALPSPVITGASTICDGTPTNLDAGVFDSYNWSTGSTLQITSITLPGTYTVTVTDGNGCTKSATKTVVSVLSAIPVVTLNPNTPVCAGTSVTLTLDSTITFTQVNPITVPNTLVNATPYPAPLVVSGFPVSGVTVKSVTLNGVSHTFPDDLDILLQSPNGTNVILMSDVGGGTDLVNQNFTFIDGFPALSDVGPITGGTYSPTNFVSPDNWSAPGPGAFTQAAPALSMFSGDMNGTWNLLIADDLAQDGGTINSWSITFEASNSNITYAWSPATGLSNTNQLVTTAAPASTTTYTVTINDGISGCTTSLSATVNINPAPIPSFNGSLSFCAGSSTTLDAGSFASYLWSTNETTQTISVNIGGIFTVTVTDGNGCTGSASVTTTVNALATPSISGTTTFCAGSSTTLDAGSYAGYNWSTGATTQTISVNTAGTFTVTVTNGNGCTGSSSVTTTVYAGTSVSITPGGSSEICPNGSVVLSAGGGALSNALVFDGQNDYVQMQDFNIGTSDFTIEAWVNPAVVNGYIVTNRTNEFAASGNWFVVSRDAASKLSLELATNNSVYSVFQGNSIIPSNAWSHIAVVRNGTAISFYVNGVLDGTFNDPIIRNLTSGNNIGRFGGWPNANAEWYNGKLDQVRIWHTARTAGDIQTSMNAIITTNVAGLYDNYTMNESSGVNTADVTTTANNGTLNNGVSRQIPSTAPIQTNSYLWSNGATTSSITATAAGTYTVTATAANGCTATATIDITTATAPAITVSNDTSLCQGSSATLTAAGGVSYSWNPAQLPLDIVPTAGLAVGLRKLKSTYSGNAIQLRRSSDNTTMDFGFVGNDLDAAAIATWLGGNTGYCTVLYDQSGNNNNVAQSNAGNQPQYLASGINGKPTLSFNTSRFMTNSANFATPYSVVYGARQTGGTRGRVLSTTANNWLLGWWGGARQQAHFDGWVTINPGTPAADNNSYIYSATGYGSSSQVYENGTLLFNNSGGLTGPNGIQLNGWLGNLSEASDCEFMDVMVFGSVLSNDHRAYAENSIGAYYNVATTASANIASISVNPTTTTTYTVTGTGSNGCTATASVTVTVNTHPVLTCPSNVTDTVAAGNCSKTVVYPAATATGNGPVTITYSQNSGATFDVGNTIVTVIATDVNGCSSTCTFNVIVKDTVAPTIACPANITAYTSVVTFATPTVTDDCFVSISGSQTFNYTGGVQTFIVPVGADSIEVTAEGAQGGFNGGLGGKTVSKLKVTPGQVLNIYVGGQGGVPGAGYNGGGVGGQGTAYYGGGGGGASDIRIGGTALNNRVIVAGGGGGKGGRSSAYSGSGAGGLGGNLSAGSGANQGAACGNSNGGFGALISNGGAGGAAQGCGCSDPGGDGIAGIGGNGAVSYSYGGAGGGGAGGGGYFGGGGAGCAGCSSCGNSDYSAGGGGGGNSYVDPLLNGSIVHYQGTRSGDGQVSISYTGGISLAQTTGLSSGSTFPLGTTTNTFVATDASGNSASCSFTVTVIDTIDPVITCPSNIVVTNTPGNCSAVVNYPTPSVTDNMCAPPTSLSGYNYLGSYDGHTYFLSNTNLNWTDAKNAAIAAGGRLTSINSAAENAFLVSVIGANAPSIGGFQNPANPNYSEPNGGWEWVDGSPFSYANWNAGEPNNSGGEDFIQIGSSGWNDIPGSYSNNYIVEMECGLTPTLYAGLPSGSTFPLGTSTVTYVAEDGSGNSDTCSFTITVEDNEAPVITTCSAAQTAYANSNCEAAVPDFTTGVVAADLCSPANLLTVTQLPVAGSLAPKGINVITITVTDTSGNSATCTTTFTVTDTIAPVINCVAGVTVNTDAGACTAVINLTPPTVSDNCPALVANGVDTFNYTGNMQTFIVPAGITSLHIVTKGAQGGDVTDYGYTGGLGAIMEGDFAVTPGNTLQIIVGGKGNPNANSSGGGGGSGVNAALTNTALIVAGGGAGIDFQEPFYVGRDAVTNINGVAGSQSGGSAGIAGANGGDYTYNGNNTSRGGNGWIIGSTGTFGLNGSSPNTTTSNGTWGLGGGGGSVGAGWCNCGGGGGGYSGGGSGNINSSGGGGGSYNSGTNQVNIGGANSGNGLVVISYAVNLPLTITQTGGLPSGSAFPIGTSNVTWTATDASGNTATCTQTVTVVDARPAVVITPSGSTNLCAGGSVTLTAPAGLSPYLWSNGQTTQAILVSTAGTYTVTVTEANGCTNSGSKSVTVVGALPANPGTISGSTTVCGNSTGTYTIPAIVNATNYIWTVGAGATITLGQGTNTITVHFTNATVNGNVTVSASNTCFNTGTSILAYTYSSGMPAKPAAMTGSFTANCVLLNMVYTCNPVANATSYFWTVPVGVKIIGGQGTTSITVNYTPAFNNKGVISVAAVNSCGMSAALKRNTSSRLNAPVISGSNFMCPNDIKTYTVAPVIGATSYTWTKVTGSVILSGQGTATVSIKWGAVGGIVKCTANNACGASIAATHSVSIVCAKVAGSAFDFSEINLYPNPATTSATVQFNAFAEGKGLLTVYDLVGQQVLSKPLNVLSGDNQFVLDLNTFPKGIYNVRVDYNGMVRNQKLVVQ